MQEFSNIGVTLYDLDAVEKSNDEEAVEMLKVYESQYCMNHNDFIREEKLSDTILDEEVGSDSYNKIK